MANESQNHPNVISTDNTLALPDRRGIGYVYYHSMLKNRGKIAQINGNTGEEESYDQLLMKCIRTAITMQLKGIRPGDFISICSPDALECFVAYIASLFIGAISASICEDMSVEENLYLLEQVNPKMIFVCKEAVELVEKVAERLAHDPIIVVFGATKNHTPFEDFLAKRCQEDQFRPREVANLDETAIVIFSSGTTGRPKGICHTHYSVLSTVTFFDRKENLQLAIFSTTYWSVFYTFAHKTLTNGFTRIVFSDLEVINPWSILKYRIDFTFFGWNDYMSFTRTEKPPFVDPSNLRELAIGGNSINMDQIAKLQSVFPDAFIHSTYGQTEVFQEIFTFPNSAASRSLAVRYPNSVGLPLAGFRYKVVDLDTEEILGPNRKGELRLRSACQTSGYYNHDSSEMFDSEGWLKTGDLVYYNEERCFFITGRIKESFKYLYHHISPVEIESVLMAHPSVGRAVVLGLPHETDDNHPFALVELLENKGNVKANDLVRYVDSRVEDQKRLRGGVKIVKRIPLTPTGKVNRFKLREMLKKQEI
ncbi:luciferin 4-monooxygenase-like isoform X2 [Photinus pyralis]|nr:luciferin 4-monooxygenase-like isoform X2 [Photinus pyralis]